MRLWTYGEVRKKLERDFDLEDESFISSDELATYCNEGIEAAEAEILTLNEDYFLKSQFMSLALGQSTVTLPSDIYAQKIRSLIYNNGVSGSNSGGDLIYEIKRIRDPHKFNIIANAQTWDAANWYGYIVQNQSAGLQNTLLLVPPSLETTTNVLTMWYIRHAQRIPLLGEYFIAQTFLPAAVNTGTSRITLPSHGYVTGDKIQLSVSTGGAAPAGLAVATVYYVVVIDANTIMLSVSLANAKAASPITISITGAGTGTFTSTVATTEANRDTVILDIPEFTTFVLQFMKVRCYEKEPDPRYDAAVNVLSTLQQQMINTLTQQVPDGDNKIPLDMEAYYDGGYYI